MEKMDSRVKTALTLCLVWTGLNTAAALALLGAGLTLLSVAGTLVTLAISVVNWLVCRAFFIKDNHSLYTPARKYFGYGAVFAYIALAIPLAGQREAGAVSGLTGTLIYALIALSSLAAAVFWLFLRQKKSQLAWGYLSAAEAQDPKLLKERQKKEKHSLKASIFDWVDTAAWAIIVVIVVQKLFFQLYAIPSESMVPTLLIGDRPLIAKFIDGPTFPFAPASFPQMAEMKRGDIGVFENPALDKKSPAARFVQEVIFYLTFSTVDLDKNPDGTPRVSRLIKRCIGVPGDRLMMIDDVLYEQKPGSSDWQKAAGDSTYSHVDLNGLPDNIRSKIRGRPLDAKGIAALRSWDQVKNTLDEKKALEELATLRTQLNTLLSSIVNSGNTDVCLSALNLSRTQIDQSWDMAKRSIASPDLAPWRFATELELDTILIGRFLTNSADRAAWLAYLDVPQTGKAATAYAQSGHAANIMLKKQQSERLLAILELALSSEKTRDQALTSYRNSLAQGNELRIWVSLYDFRNFPPFPENGAIPKDSFFFMGDNRYNSVDCRFDAEQDIQPLPFDRTDPASTQHFSMLGLRLIPKEYVIGRSVFRLFPFNRIGLVH